MQCREIRFWISSRGGSIKRKVSYEKHIIYTIFTKSKQILEVH